jgi:hypothetical protein
MKSPLLAGALGEGIISAGAAAEETRQQTKDGLLTPKQAALTAISGAGTAMFSLVGGRVATKFGITDPDVFLAGGSSVTSTGIVKRIIGGGISEGVFEELPQSMQEQIWLNAALDKPLLEGVSEAGATGMLTGMAMGAGFNVFTGKPYSPEDITPPAETAAKQERTEREARIEEVEPAEITEAEKRQAEIDREFAARRTPEERQAEIEAAMPATPMTTISEETTKLAEEGIRPSSVEEIVPEAIPLVPTDEALPAPMRAMGMRPSEPVVVPFMITKETETKLADLGYAEDDIAKMTPEDALGIVEAKIAKEVGIVEVPTKEPVKPEKIPAEFVGMQERVGKPSFPIVTELDEGKSTVAYDSEKHDITVKKAEYEKAVAAKPHVAKPPKPTLPKIAEEVPEAKKPIKPEVEIPVLTNTTQAIEFGEKATPEQITELKRLRKEALEQYSALLEEDKLNEAGKEALKAQLYREAFEAKKKLAKPTVSKPPTKVVSEAVESTISPPPIPEVAPKVEKREKEPAKPKEPAKKEKPFVPDLKKMPLSDIQVKIQAISEATGKITTIEENAATAIEESDAELEKYYEILSCL